MASLGTLEEIHCFPRIVEWRIPDFSHLLKHTDNDLISPIIQFWQGRYRFVIQPNGTCSLPDMMVLTFQEINRCEGIRWELEIRCPDDKVLRKCGGCNMRHSIGDGEMNLFIPISEIQKGCSDCEFLRFICILYCEDALTNPERERIYEDMDSQTASTLGTDNLSYDLEELLIRGDDSDVIIKVENKEFKVHKNILRARTPVFNSMFKHEMLENITNFVDINDCDAITFGEFLNYLYTGRVSKLSASNVFSLYRIADKYQVMELVQYCLEYIKNNLSIEIFCDTVILSMQYNEEELIDMVIAFFSKNISKIVKMKEWQCFSIENPSESNWLFVKALSLHRLKVFSTVSNVLVGTIEEIHKFPRILEWRIPNFFALPNFIGSPTFKFGQYYCAFVALPNGTERLPDTVIFMLKGFGKTGTTYWQLEAYRTDETLLRKYGGLKEDGSEVSMSMFIPFSEVKSGCYPSSLLKVRCVLHCKETLNYPGKESYAHTASQTETISRTDRLSHDLQELLYNRNDSNITIRVEGKKFKVYKNILRARSLLFSSIFKNEVPENIIRAMEIHNCDAISFREFLHYLYTGTLTEYSLNSLFSQYKLANKHQVNGLKICCIEYIMNNLSIDTFCEILMFSIQYNDENLINMVTEFYSNNMTEINNLEKWCNFLLENPSESNQIHLKALKLQIIKHLESEADMAKRLTAKQQTITFRNFKDFCILS